MGVVTVSASYGAGGSEIGPAVAEALGLPFVDRAVPAGVARKLDVPLDLARQRDETTDRGLWRVISSMALVPEMAGAGPLAYHTFADEHAFREKTEEVLHEIAGIGGVVLGRAAAIVLAGRDDALHVRLDGPVEGRVARSVQRSGRSEAEVRRALRSNDAARAAYVRNFYRADPADARHYHLVIDTTAIPWNAAAELVVAAARARGL
ncbi:MAG TPA: cytidylate kinase-like family protein [Mycobacteriales bacterium]|nr:cytidylate kinase-like family protein [Mycobacteriales bacterium]